MKLDKINVVVFKRAVKENTQMSNLITILNTRVRKHLKVPSSMEI